MGPPASNRFLSPWGLGLEEGEGLLDEVLLCVVVPGDGLLCVVVLAL